MRILNVPLVFIDPGRRVISAWSSGHARSLLGKQLGSIYPNQDIFRALIWQREASKRKWERRIDDPRISISSYSRPNFPSSIYFWARPYVLVTSSSFSSSLVSDSFGEPVRWWTSRLVASSTASFVPSSVIMTPGKNCQCCVCGISASTHALGVSNVYNRLLDTFSYTLWHLNLIMIILPCGK